MAFGSLYPSMSADPAAASAELPDVGAPLIPSGPTVPGWAPTNRLFGLGGERRVVTWPEQLGRDAWTVLVNSAEGNVLPPGLRREDYTDIPPPQEHGANTTPGIFGNTWFKPQAAQPNDAFMEGAQSLAGMMGGGMMFGRMAGPGGLSVGRDLRVLGRKVGSGEPFPHQLIDQPPKVAEPYITLGPVDAMQRPIEARIDADLGRAANDTGLTSVRGTGRLLSDTATPGGPLAALESSVLPRRINPLENADQLKELANQRRARGENVGQSAEGWDFKRPDPEPGTLEWDAAVAKAEAAAKTPSPESPLLSAEDHDFINKGGFYADSAVPGAPIAALEHAAPFYSGVERAVEALPMNKATGEQWASTLANRGVKPEEMDWTGLKDFLAEKGTAPVTKAEVQAHLADNGVKLGEVTKGDNADLARWKELDSMAVKTPAERAEYENLSRNSPNIGDTKFHGYQLPGGENYREKLLTLPKKFKRESFEEARARIDAGDFPQDYRSSHWDEPNVLVHRRTNERDVVGGGEQFKLRNRASGNTTKAFPSEQAALDHLQTLPESLRPNLDVMPAGQMAKKSLHLEEIQSDWHQAGRKQGYQGSAANIDKTGMTAQEVERYGTPYWQILDKEGNHYYSVPKEGNERGPLTSAQEAIDFAVRTKHAADTSAAVPNAPFKKNWHELALKDAIREAAEKGFDRISWTPGEAQAARYDLSKQVDSVIYRPDTQELSAYKGKNYTSPVFQQQKVSPEKLSDFIGKEAADRLLKTQPVKHFKGHNIHVLEGEQLKVGGEGMKGFYDKMIPDALNKIGKPHGVRVQRGETTTSKTAPTFSIYDESGNHVRDIAGRDEALRWKSRNHPEGSVRITEKTESGTAPVHYMDIPPSLKEQALKKGFSLFEDSATTGAPLAALERTGAPAIVKTKLFDENGMPIPGAAYSKEARAALDEISAGPKGAGPMDLSTQAKVPNVPQEPLPRYIPPRGISPRMVEALQNPAVREGLQQSMEAGSRVSDWYHTDPVRRAFVDELGPKTGEAEFKRYMDTIAATSPRSDVPTNIRNASYYYSRGSPENLPAKNPYPYGHVAQNLHRGNFETISGEGGWNPLQNPKPASFAENLRGNLEPVTVDTHAFRNIGMRTGDPRFLETSFTQKLGPGERGPNSLASRFGEVKGKIVTYRPQQLLKEGRLTMEEAQKIPAFWASKPTKTEYAAAEGLFRETGNKLGLRPADAQAAAWAGGGEMTGLGTVGTHTFPELLNERILFTAKMRGENPQKTLSDFIRGKATLLEDSSATGAPVAALEHATAPRNVDWKALDATERSLSPTASKAMDSWVGGTVDTMKDVEAGHHPGWGVFNRSAMDNPEALQELRAAFQPLRDQLKAEHGDEVTLYRHHGDIPENAKPHDMLSFTNDKSIAEGLSGARPARKIVGEDEIAAKEAEFAKTGRVQVSKSTWLEKKKDMIWNGKEEVPVEYTAIMRPDGMVTDTPSVREYFQDENSWNHEDNAKRDAALAKVKSYKIPVDDIVAATNRFGQQEFIVRNSKGLFEDAATTGAPLSALEHAAGAPDAAKTAAREAAAPARGDGPGGAGGGDASLREAQAAAARRAGAHQPLEGLPTKAMKIGDEHFVPGPIGKVRDVAAQYMADRETPSYHTPPTKYHPLDEEHSKAVARAFDEMDHNPNDPATKASYDALINETAAQYQAVKKSGLKIEPIPKDMPDPYAKNPRLAAKDVADNNHLWFFPTDAGFGSNPGAKIDMAAHPMMRKTGEKIGDHELLANDMFRIVHDYFGHLKEGYGFRAAGEDNAWRSHASMYSDIARPAMTTETRGQNSWVNYGPHGERNRTASAADTVYADQKVGLMPEWTMRDRGSPEPIIAYHGSPYSFDRFGMEHIGTGEGNASYGEGLYFGGHSPVSEWYRHQLSARRDPILPRYGLDAEDGAHVGMRLAKTNGDTAPVIADLEKEIAGLRSDGDTSKGTQNMIQRRRAMVNYLNDPERNKGHMYQVAIDHPPESFLDWDKPLKEQGADLARLAEVAFPADRGLRHFQSSAGNISGADLFSEVLKRAKSPESASKILADAGMRGIKYLDQGSRSLGKGTHNYVTFDAPRILKKYAVPGLIGAGGFGSLAPRREQ